MAESILTLKIYKKIVCYHGSAHMIKLEPNVLTILRFPYFYVKYFFAPGI